MRGAAVTSSLPWWADIDQPTTRRLNPSRTTARNKNPDQVRTYVMSATQRRSGPPGAEVTLEQVGNGPGGLVAARCATEPPPGHALDAVEAHQPGHPTVAHGVAPPVHQLGPDPSVPVGLAALGVDGTDIVPST